MTRTSFSAVTSQAEIDRIKAQSESSIVMQPGQQSDLMYRYEFETLITGCKGSGKTIASIVWLIRGNLDVADKDKDQTDIFYINNPLFRAAVVRRNIDDLNDWVEHAKRVYGTDGDLLGATYTKQPREFTWPSGAKIILTHMGDSDAYMRLTGQSLTRLFWDEITFEPSLDNYEKVYSSIRSTHKKLRAQILLACNPEGPGLGWVKERFIKQTDEKGNLCKAGDLIRIKKKNIITGKMIEMTRIYFHWTLAQNKILLENDPDYPVRLAMSGNPSLVSAYLYGDWDAAGGKFFEFRRKPKPGEPDNACHIYDADKTVIEPWWPRLIGFDWGYAHYAAAYKIAMSPDGRVWVLDEMAYKGMGARDWGVALARWCISDLSGLKTCGLPPAITAFISPDAIDQKRNEFGTIAENIRDGIRSVLGEGSAEIFSEEASVPGFEARRDIQREAKITLRRATNKRVFGWEEIRQLMSWTSAVEPDLHQFDKGYADKLAEVGAEEYFKYMDQFLKKPEALPRLQISSHIKHLPDAFESAVSSPTDLNDVAIAKQGNKEIAQLHDDCRDAIRYGLVGTKLYKQITVPAKNRVDSFIAQHPEMTPDQIMSTRQFLMSQQDSKKINGFRVGRGANAGVMVS